MLKTGERERSFGNNIENRVNITQSTVKHNERQEQAKRKTDGKYKRLEKRFYESTI